MMPKIPMAKKRIIAAANCIQRSRRSTRRRVPRAPLVADGETKLVLDIDSDKAGDFAALDQQYLEQIVALIKRQHFS